MIDASVFVLSYSWKHGLEESEIFYLVKLRHNFIIFSKINYYVCINYRPWYIHVSEFFFIIYTWSEGDSMKNYPK